jgi:hypothetical protein
LRQLRYERWQFFVLEGVWAAVLIGATTVAVLVGGSGRRGFVMLAVIALASLVVVEVQRRIAAMHSRSDPGGSDEAALEAREHRWRLAALGAVFALMALAFVFVDGRPRVAFATFAGIAVYAAINLERQRRDPQPAPQGEPERRESEPPPTGWWRRRVSVPGLFRALFVVWGALLIMIGILGMSVGAGPDGQYVAPLAVGIVVLASYYVGQRRRRRIEPEGDA